MDEVQAVVFDMDGVLLDSGEIWERIITELFVDCRVAWDDFDQDAFAGGDNSQQWASYLKHVVGLPLEEEEIISRVVEALLRAYEKDLPLLPGAMEAVARLARDYPLGLASSSPHAVIAFVLERSGLDGYFTAWVSSDEVPRGKPAPDVYLEACRRLAAEPDRCVAVEDSRFGIRAANAARLKVIAIPNHLLPLDTEALGLVDETLESIEYLSPEAVRETMAGRSALPEPPNVTRLDMYSGE